MHFGGYVVDRTVRCEYDAINVLGNTLINPFTLHVAQDCRRLAVERIAVAAACRAEHFEVIAGRQRYANSLHVEGLDASIRAPDGITRRGPGQATAGTGSRKPCLR